MNISELENWLRRQGDGVGVSKWNDTFDVTCMTGDLKGGARTILGSGATIEGAISNAEVRIAELATRGLTPQRHAHNLAQPQGPAANQPQTVEIVPGGYSLAIVPDRASR